jgi:hypothetical protein
MRLDASIRLKARHINAMAAQKDVAMKKTNDEAASPFARIDRRSTRATRPLRKGPERKRPCALMG